MEGEQLLCKYVWVRACTRVCFCVRVVCVHVCVCARLYIFLCVDVMWCGCTHVVISVRCISVRRCGVCECTW
jgi:hypothetical protein